MTGLDQFSLAGRVALVTGGNGGIGRDIALALVGAGPALVAPSMIPPGGYAIR